MALAALGFSLGRLDALLLGGLGPETTTTYRPNSTGCTGQWGTWTDTTLPPTTLALADAQTEYTPDERDEASDDDDGAVASGRSASLISGDRLDFTIVENVASVTQMTLTFKGYGCSNVCDDAGCSGMTMHYGITVYAWNFIASEWTYMGVDTSSTKATVTLGLPTVDGGPQYSPIIDGSGHVYVAIAIDNHDPNGWGGQAMLLNYFSELEVTSR
jgi:hypothetical protein